MSSETLKELINPSALMRIAPFWCWNDKLDKDELIRQLHEMSDKGWGSYFMHCRGGVVTKYLSDEWMELVNACADEAAKTGTHVWIYDEDRWPSCYAGGIVPRQSEAFRARALVLLKKGTATEDDTFLRSVEHAGVEYEICKRVSPMGELWFNGTCFVDQMNPEVVRGFLDCTHEAYKNACGEHFGGAIPGIFTDEPAYLSWWISTAVHAVPWSEYLQGFFQEFKGYDILDKVEELFFDIGDYHATRFDFYHTATELFQRSYTKQCYDWCEENNLILTGHYLFEDSTRLQAQWCGDVMAHYEFMHWPGIDRLGKELDHLVTIKQLSSAAEQLGKERALCEVFAGSGQQTDFAVRKHVGDWQAVLGINFLNQSLAAYSLRGERKHDHPVNMFYQQPWWDDERGFADYQARVSAFAAEGKRMVDILILQPLSTAWSIYSPLHKLGNFAEESTYDLPFESISNTLMAEKIDFHYGNETLMARHASVKDDCIAIGDYGYKFVIVPPTLNLRASTIALLREYAGGGNKLILVGTPRYIDGVESEVSISGAVVVESIEEAVKAAREFALDRVSVIDTLTGKNADKVYVCSRSVGASTRHFIANSDNTRPVWARIHIPQGVGTDMAVFDLYDGRLYKLDAVDGSFDVQLSPAGSLLVLCGEEARGEIAAPPSVLGSGAAFRSFDRVVPNIFIDTFNCEPCEENVLLLNDFILELDGQKVHEGPVCDAWYKHFYPAQDGTAFRATYTFQSEAEVEGCFAAIEVAENLDSITFNGVPVTPLKARGELGVIDPGKSWKDISFTKVPLPTIPRGTNELVIEGKKVNNISTPCGHSIVDDPKNHIPTEAEEVYICGRFKVKGLSEALYVISQYAEPRGKNLTYEGFPFYAGSFRYRASFSVGSEPAKEVFLKLNGVHAASARVMVNGEKCGVLRWQPFVLDISKAVKAGENQLEIEISTTLANLLGPNRCAGRKADGQIIWTEQYTEMGMFKESYDLFDFGLDSVGIIYT